MLKFTKAEIRNAIFKSNGTYTDVARQLKIKSGCLTAQKHIARYPELQKLMDEKQRSLVDIAESTLIECLHSSNENIRQKTAEFICKTVGRDKWGDGNELDTTQSKLTDVINKLIDNAQK